MASLPIATTRSRDLQPLAAAGQTGIEAWGTLHALLLRELSPAHAALLAEPVANEARGEVDWYAEGDGPAVPLQNLPDSERAAAQARRDRLAGDIGALAARLAGSRAEGDRFLSDMLGLALRLPDENSVYVRNGQPVLVGWGHVRSGGRGGGAVLTGRTAPPAAPAADPAAAAIPLRRGGAPALAVGRVRRVPAGAGVRGAAAVARPVRMVRG